MLSYMYQAPPVFLTGHVQNAKSHNAWRQLTKFCLYYITSLMVIVR
jgi:hypothetical protein